ncbi:MAG: hypothetical protein LBE61_05570 [Burkholderiaceae bacterium]|nr:hypothetical protein [Burkholderiaceae bacterium]
MRQIAIFFLGFFLITMAIAITNRKLKKYETEILYGVIVSFIFLLMIAGVWLDCSPWSLIAVGISVIIAFQIHYKRKNQYLHLSGRRYLFLIYVNAIFGLAVLIYIYIPMIVFMTSPGEIELHMDRLIEINVRNVMVVVIVSLAIYFYIKPIFSKLVATSLLVGVYFLCIFYTFFMPFGYSALSGLSFERIPIPMGVTIFRGIVDFSILLILAFVLRYVVLQYGVKPIFISLLIANISIFVSSASSLLMRTEVAENRNGVLAQAEKPIVLSKDNKNVLIIMLDRFMGSFVETLLKKDPQIFRDFSGFVWYPKSVSAGENSIAGIHPILGGYDYTPSEINKRDDNLRKVSNEAFSVMPENFLRQGYRVSMVNPRGLGFTVMGDCDVYNNKKISCAHIPSSISREAALLENFSLSDLAEANYADLLIMLASMRISPYLVKEAIYSKGPWQPFLDHSAGTTFKEMAELNALAHITRIDKENSGFNFISNIITHEPYYLREDCGVMKERVEYTKSELDLRGFDSIHEMQHLVAARCALLSVARYLNFLKENDAYDNTEIVIVSDHGIVGGVRDKSSRAKVGGAVDNNYVRFRPLMLIKDIGSTGKFTVSDDFMPNAEVPRIVCRQIGGCINPFLNGKPIQAMGRDDPFYVSIVPWQFSAQNEKSFFIKSSYVLEGKDPFNASAWKKE